MNIVTHDSIKPIYNAESKVLILGSIPSPKSREIGFYYGHPQNKFWKVLSDVFNVPLLDTVDKKTEFLLSNKIALWDVLSSCTIEGADDLSIKNPIPNDINTLLMSSKIEYIFTTGNKAFALYKRLCLKETGIEAILLPSTSPANCRFYKYEDLVEEYKKIKSVLS